MTLYLVGLLECLAKPLEGPVEQLDSEVLGPRVHASQNANDRVQVLHVCDLEYIYADLATLTVLNHFGQLLGNRLRMLRKIPNIETIVLVDKLAEVVDCRRGDGFCWITDALVGEEAL